MLEDLDPESYHRLLHQKLKASSSSIYLTALSVIQGAALADLAMTVVESYRQFTIGQWLLSILNFVILINIWHAYTTQSSMWEWIPDLRDAIIPFVFGALELFLNHAIVLHLSTWLLVLALLIGVAAFANWYSVWRAKEEPENASLLSLLSARQQNSAILITLGLSSFMLLLAVVSRLAGLDLTESVRTGRGILAMLIILLVGAGLGTYIFFTLQAWNQVVAYARKGRQPNREKPPSSE